MHRYTRRPARSLTRTYARLALCLATGFAGALLGAGPLVPAAHAAGVVTMTNGVLEVSYASGSKALQVKDLRNGKAYTQAGFQAGDTPPVLAEPATGPITATFRLSGVKSDVSYTIALSTTCPYEVDVTLDADPKAAMPGTASFPPSFVSEKGQFVLLPQGEGVLWPVEDKAFDGWWHQDLAMSGVLDLPTGAGYQAIYDTPFDADTEMRTSKGLWTTGVVWQPTKGTFGYARRMAYRFYDSGGYVRMAKEYRERALARGYIKPFTQKVVERPSVAKLRGAADIWLMSQGVMSPDFIRRLRLLGVDRALLSLGTGWEGPSGVDGIIDFANSKGYLTSRYDIYTDVWNEKDGPPSSARTSGYPEDVIADAKGNLQKGWVIKEGGENYQGYYTCALTHTAVAKSRIADDLVLNHYNARFIDVVTSAGLYECWAAAHPATREDDASARARLLGTVSGTAASGRPDGFGLVTGSEQSREWAMPVTDFGEGTMSIESADNAGYDWMTPVAATPVYVKRNATAAYRVPLVSLVYHDTHMSTWYTGDGLAKVPDAWEKKELLNTLYGSMPLWMFDDGLWDQSQSDFIKSYQNANMVFRQVGFSELTNHEMLSADRNVQRTTFGDGTTVTANFGAAPWPLGVVGASADKSVPVPPGLKLPQLDLDTDGYIAAGPGLFAFRGLADGTRVNAVRASDRVFLEPYAKKFDLGPVASDHMVLLHAAGPLEKAGQCWLVVWGGDSSGIASVEVRPDQLGAAWSGGIARAMYVDESGLPAEKANMRVSPSGSATLRIGTVAGSFSIVELTAVAPKGKK